MGNLSEFFRQVPSQRLKDVENRTPEQEHALTEIRLNQLIEALSTARPSEREQILAEIEQLKSKQDGMVSNFADGGSVLSSIFSAADSVKRRVKDFASNPGSVLQMIADQQRRQWKEDPTEQAMNLWNPEGAMMAGVTRGGGLADYVASRISSAEKLANYTRSRIPDKLKALGDLVPMKSGTGRAPYALGDDLIVKTTRMPRGFMENSMEGDWVAPVPEAVWKSDDDAIAIVKRALPADASLKRQVKDLQSAIRWKKDPQYDSAVQEKLEGLGWGDLLNYDPLWGDIVPRNVGIANTAERSPILLDAGILNRSIMNPDDVEAAIGPSEWAKYRAEVLRSKAMKDGGVVTAADPNEYDHILAAL